MEKLHTTHSFFNFIFVRKSEYRGGHFNEVLLHEQVHANKWHSLDLLIVGLLSILQWFNPFIYLFKRTLTETHEFQADQALLEMGTDKAYCQQLLQSQVKSIVFAGLTTNFNQSLIKNRLKMMNRIKSRNSAIIKYVMIIPVIFAFSIVFDISQEKLEASVSEFALHTPNGPLVGSSKIVQMDLKSDIVSIEADGGFYHDQDSDKFHFFGNKITGKTEDGSFSLSADNIYFEDSKKIIYGFSNDYLPSIYPVPRGKFTKPTGGFGMKIHPILKIKKMHYGVDFSAPVGTEVLATAEGIVRSARYGEKDSKAYGNMVIIDHGNVYSTSYSHMQKYVVEAGQSVSKGDIIGYVGNTGLSARPHLHYEIMKDGKYVDPKNYLGKPAK